MLSKEEIEKAKEICNSMVEFCKNNKECQENKICSDCYIEIEDISAIRTLLQYIEQLEFQIQAKEMDHKYDVNMIDEVKGESVKLYKEIRKQNKIINEMAKKLNKLQDIPDKDCFIPREYSDIDDCVRKTSCIECIKQYFEKKVEEK